MFYRFEREHSLLYSTREASQVSHKRKPSQVKPSQAKQDKPSQDKSIQAKPSQASQASKPS
jgi:hypothetical protein